MVEPPGVVEPPPGVVLGVGATLLQQHYGLIRIPAESFLMQSYPVEFRWTDLAAVAVAWALDISPELMAAGMETFDPTAQAVR